MTTEFIKNLIDQAHGHILNGDSDNAIEMLSSIKLRVHEEEPVAAIKAFTKDTDAKFDVLREQIISSTDDPIRKDLNIANANHKRAMQYLDFFDGLIRQYDI